MDIIDFDEQYLEDILALNLVHEHKLAPLDAEKLRDFVATIAIVKVLLVNNEFVGYSIVVDSQSNYTGVNFNYFKQRHSNFVYLDRIAIDDKYQGKGLGKAYYQQLFENTKQQGKDFVGIEVNSKPLNVQSMEFHASIGFDTVGEQQLGDKVVTYLIKKL